MTTAQRVASFLGIFAGVALFAVSAVTAPDDGPDQTTLATGLRIGAVVAAAPVGALLSKGVHSAIVALGGGMLIAGAATTPGGNLAGLVMAVAGFVLLSTGASGASEVTWRLFGSTVAYAIVLVVAMYSALAVRTGTVIALVIAVAVATSPRWTQRRLT